jgi:hypothetical protein
MEVDQIMIKAIQAFVFVVLSSSMGSLACTNSDTIMLTGRYLFDEGDRIAATAPDRFHGQNFYLIRDEYLESKLDEIQGAVLRIEARFEPACGPTGVELTAQCVRLGPGATAIRVIHLEMLTADNAPAD